MHLLDQENYSSVLDFTGVTLGGCCCYDDVGGNLVEQIRPLPYVCAYLGNLEFQH